jgi:hypothetical protein
MKVTMQGTSVTIKLQLGRWRCRNSECGRRIFGRAFDSVGVWVISPLESVQNSEATEDGTQATSMFLVGHHRTNPIFSLYNQRVNADGMSKLKLLILTMDRDTVNTRDGVWAKRRPGRLHVLQQLIWPIVMPAQRSKSVRRRN